MIPTNMEIANIDNRFISAGNSVQAEKNSNSMGKDGFLQLLITQLRNQDPINPMDGAEFATQLASFNSLEQLINLNQSVENLAIAQQIMSTGLNNTLAASLTGKTVSAMSDKIIVNGEDQSEIHVRLARPATQMELTVRDSNGSVVRRLQSDALTRGDHSISWDQKDDSGNILPEGIYTVEIMARNGEDLVQSMAFLKGTVDRVRYTHEGVKLMIGGISIPMGDIEEVGTEKAD